MDLYLHKHKRYRAVESGKGFNFKTGVHLFTSYIFGSVLLLYHRQLLCVPCISSCSIFYPIKFVFVFGRMCKDGCKTAVTYFRPRNGRLPGYSCVLIEFIFH
jgi:hypothetical protein